MRHPTYAGFRRSGARLGGMNSVALAPRPALAGFVELYWAEEATDRTPGLERVLPSGTTDVVFDLRDPARPALVCGPHSRPFTMERAARESYAGIHFKPGGAAALLGVVESELANAHVELDAIWGRSGRELGARLCEAATPELRLRLLEQTLLARLERARPRHPAVTYALCQLSRSPAPRSIGEIGEATGLSARRFIALFTAQVGLTPKLFARVRRFQRVLKLAHARPRPDWIELALGCGYYDQAHLVRDFGDFAALAPSAYLRLRSHDPNHLALPVQT